MRVLALALALAACGGSPTPATTTAQPTTTQPTEPAPADTGSAAEPGTATAGADGASDVVAQAALAEQYELGKTIYKDKGCASCHGDRGQGNPRNPPVIGEAAYPAQPLATAKLRKGVTFTTAGDVLAFVKAKMPIKQPGSLSDEQAAAVTSWMLSESKVNITAKLDASNAASINLR